MFFFTCFYLRGDDNNTSCILVLYYYSLRYNSFFSNLSKDVSDVLDIYAFVMDVTQLKVYMS